MRDRVCLFLSNTGNAYQAAMAREAAVAAERQGLRLDVHDAAVLPDRQLEQILAALRGPAARDIYAALVFPLTDAIHERAGREATRAGIGWVLLNRDADYIADLRAGFPRLPIFCVTPDHKQIGRAQGGIVKALLPGGGRVLTVTGPLTTISARLRREGLEEALQGAGFQIAHTQADWTGRGGERAVRGWELRVDESGALRHPVLFSFVPDAVVAHNDAMGEGARRALVKAGRSARLRHIAQIPIVGCDGARELGLRLVEEKVLAATVILPGTAGPAIDLLAELRRGGKRPEATVHYPISTFPALDRLAPVPHLPPSSPNPEAA